MSANPTAGLWARTALIWFLITMSFGMYMGMTRQFHLGPSHAHMGVLGWLSSAVFATIYMVAGAGQAGSKSPMLHWAVHNIGVAVMTGALFMELSHPGGPWGGIIPIGGLIIILGAIWLAVMVWSRLGRA
jgi:hypothetical protein